MPAARPTPSVAWKPSDNFSSNSSKEEGVEAARRNEARVGLVAEEVSAVAVAPSVEAVEGVVAALEAVAEVVAKPSRSSATRIVASDEPV
jgi:hypothetical protein